jgi:2,4-dienoyl-CoA reductase-like NADH-dependent reductase (Old Yellow Enzyme family)
MSSILFSPLNLRRITLRNRIVVSPMCQYSSEDGFATNWHLVHLGSRATGGAGLVFTEATAVEARGRISPQDLGIWKNEHIAKLREITDFIKSQGAVPGMQLAHAGRKAATRRPWEPGPKVLSKSEGAWEIIGPSPIPFDVEYQVPHELTPKEMEDVAQAFVDGAKRAFQAGFQVIEVHAAHGYLLHEFLSPLSNQRKDEYGGSFENRIRFPLEVIQKVRQAWPEELPLFVRISATDWMEGGWNLEESVEFAKILKKIGVDLIDCSSGGLHPAAQVPAVPGYQVPFARKIRSEAGIAAGAVGFITKPEQAETILQDGAADVVVIARELLRNPYWPLHAAKALGEDLPNLWPPQYLRAKL